MTTTVVNIRDGGGGTNTKYIARAGHGEQGYFGNPIKFRETCEVCGRVHFDSKEGRKDMLACYKVWFWNKVNTDKHYLKRVVAELKGEALGCFCHPKPCHGHVIKAFLDWTDTPKGKTWLSSKL